MYKIKTPSMKTLFFLKSFFRNFMLLMLPLIVVSIYSLYRFNKDAVNTIEARNWNLMYQIKTQADSMFQTVDTISSFLSETSSISRTVQDVFLNELISSKTAKQASALSQYLQSIIDSNSFIHSAYLYFENDFGRYIATSNGRSFIRSHSNRDWIDSNMISDKKFWFKSEKINTYSKTVDKDVISVYQKIFPSYSSVMPSGILVTYYSLDSIKDYIDKLEIYPGQIILFLPQNDSPIFQNSDKDFSNIWSEMEHNIVPQSSFSTFQIEHSGTTYTASLLPASKEELYYVSLIPNHVIFDQTKNLTRIYLFIAFTTCVLSICLSLINAKKEYNQLKNIIDIFNNVDQNSPVTHHAKIFRITNPYQLILQNVINLFLEKRYLKLQIDNKQYQMEVLEMKALQYQINPHFLFNTLHMIYWEAIRFTNKPNTCSDMISDLSEIVSYALTDVQKKVAVHNELEYLQHYTNIQEMRYEHKFELIWDIDDEVTDMLIIKMVLQPLVENCIYHGIKPIERHGIIKIKLYYQNNRINVHVLDNGLGINNDKLAEIKNSLINTKESLDHIGLININRRLVLTYGEDSSIKISSRYGMGTIVSFSIPAEKKST